MGKKYIKEENPVFYYEEAITNGEKAGWNCDMANT
jgi:hypothetical protein